MVACNLQVLKHFGLDEASFIQTVSGSQES